MHIAKSVESVSPYTQFHFRLFGHLEHTIYAISVDRCEPFRN